MRTFRRLLILYALLDFLAGYAGFVPGTSLLAVGQTTYQQSYGPVSSLVACTAAAGVATSSVNTPCGGQGAMFQNANVLLHTVSWTAVAGTGSVSTCTLELETSSAGATFVIMSGSVQQTCTSSGSYTFLAAAGANFVKVNLNALTTIGTASVTVNYIGTASPPAQLPIAYAINCGLTTTCTPVNISGLKIAYGSCTASAATTCTVTGLPQFTSSSSYFCAVSDATTATAAYKVTYASATSFVITTGVSSSDVLNYFCWGT